MKIYDKAVIQMLDLLKQRNVCGYSIKVHRVCYEELRYYLIRNNLSFNTCNARAWLKEEVLDNNSNNLFQARWHYVDQLTEFISTGTVIQDHLLLNKSFYDKIYGNLKRQLDEYLEFRKNSYTTKSFTLSKIRCSEFVLFLQEHGLQSFEEIQFEHVLAYYELEMPVTRDERYVIISQAKQLLEYLVSALDLCPALPMILEEDIYRYTASKHLFSSEVIASMRETCKNDTILAARDIFTFIPSFIKEFEIAEYRGTVQCNASHTIRCLYVFLELNQLGYNEATVSAWFELIQNETGASYRSWIRILRLFELYVSKEKLNFRKKYTFTPSRTQDYPSWCITAICEYEKWLMKSFHKEETYRTYKYSVYALCEFLISIDVSNFQEITKEMLRNFMKKDNHSTTKGSSSRYTVLRQFIGFLEDNRFIDDKTLHHAFPYKMAHSVRVISVLTDDQVCSIDNFRKNCSTPIELRDAAMVMVGLKLGFRASDVINLRFSSIDWKNRKVSIVQYKTNVHIEMPLNPDVGNALYRYIKYGRPNYESDNIFIRHKAPYEPLSGKICVNALNRILNSCGYSKVHGFHILRKTFATRILRNNAGIEMVIDALGHQDKTSVDNYLTFDAEHMKMCPLSLKEISIEIGGVQ